MQIEFIQTFHPLALFSLIAVAAFIWGLQAALGANVGHRRDLQWQTAFLLGLLFSGILFVAFYSIRPLTNTSPVKSPVWVERLGGRLPIILLAVAAGLTVIMEVISFLPPVYLLAVPWFVFFVVGIVLSLLAFITFTCMGGYMGVKWLEKRSTRPDEFGLSRLLPTWSNDS
jgi:MFS family permease